MSKDIERIKRNLISILEKTLRSLYEDADFVGGGTDEDGFYYDIELKKGESISEKDLAGINKKMKDGIDCVGMGWSFTSDCFDLVRVAAAHRNPTDDKPTLTRIYGYAQETMEELNKFKAMMEEGKKRDHRKIGTKLDLFAFSDLIGPGLPLFTPKGTAIRDALIKELNKITDKFGYKRVCIPHLAKAKLYEKSGHTDKFAEDLFFIKDKKHGDMVIKPMNCPHHCQIYNSSPKSYRDLPVRYSEITSVYRNEQPGELLGLSRVLSITQDDGHIFCTKDQIKEEAERCVLMIKEFYERLGMFSIESCNMTVSVRDMNHKEKYLGDDRIWDESEDILMGVAQKAGLGEPKKIEGEAAFYGPKIDFIFKDVLGRNQQLSTIQLDFNIPKRLDVFYTDNEGKKQHPILIHRAITGSLERFIAILIENFEGNFPFWLSPVQVVVISVSEKQVARVNEVADELKSAGIRAETDNSDNKLGKKIYKAKDENVPYYIIIGDKEMESGDLTIESREGEKQTLGLKECVEKLKEVYYSKR
ncbi:MAG: threonine--tRNA ligase [Candidatus Campbellbacteria bacterium]|nr:threonine--tRNA ligase [Candidatus Campbellbacteria bacterium]